MDMYVTMRFPEILRRYYSNSARRRKVKPERPPTHHYKQIPSSYTSSHHPIPACCSGPRSTDTQTCRSQTRRPSQKGVGRPSTVHLAARTRPPLLFAIYRYHPCYSPLNTPRSSLTEVERYIISALDAVLRFHPIPIASDGE